MANTPEIRAPQSSFVTVAAADIDVRVSQFQALALYNMSTFEIRAAQASFEIVTKQSIDLEASQLAALAVVRGRVSNPKLRAWTFTLDGHDFYVLRLGDTSTLVYDVYSQQWMDWCDPENPFWRANVGTNWLGGAGLAPTFGSNIVVGDDTNSILWILDPTQPYDQHPDELAPVQERYFERATMGQVPMRARTALPCYATWITTDLGDPAYVGAGVTLYTSDDAGHNFINQGTVQVVAGNQKPQIAWYSLGQIEAPGRLFKIVDDGAIARIDSLEMNDRDDR